jgi:hypothetical protein
VYASGEDEKLLLWFSKLAAIMGMLVLEKVFIWFDGKG